MKSLRIIATLAILSVLPATHAHPGHSLQEADTLHLLTSPYHLTVLTLSGAALLLGARFIQRRVPRCLMQGLGVVSLLAAAILWQAR